MKEPRRIPTKRRRGKFDEERERRNAQPGDALEERPATNRTDCLHLAEPTDDSVEQKNCGCPGNKMTSVWTCELFGRVAPFAKGDPVDGVRACQKCDAYEKPQTPTPQSPTSA